MKQIPHRKKRRCHLANHRGHRRAHHAPLAAEDENRVQDDVQHRPGQGGDHGEAGAAVGPDHRVHGLAEHIKRDAQGDVEEILLRTAESLLVDGAAEHGDDAVGEDQIHRRQHQAGGHGQHHGVAHAAAGPLAVTAAQGHADKGAAAVPHHHGDGQGHHRQGEHHRVGGVAVGPQIVGVGNEDLVHDVVQGSHQQGDHAGNGVAAHEPPYVLRSQKIVGMFHKISLSFLQNPRLRGFWRKKKSRGVSATGFTQKRHTL